MHAAPESITEFLTDGSLAALCASLGDLADHTITLRDRLGRVIEKQTGEPPWALREDADAPHVRESLDRIQNQRAPDAAPDGKRLVPLRTAGRVVGALVAAPNKPGAQSPPRLLGTLGLVAQTVGELCDQEVEARRRGRELRVLYELSALLVGSHDISAMLDAALRAAALFFNADAGSVHLLDHETHNLTLRAWHGVSIEFTQRLRELPDQEAADLDSQHGRVIAIDDDTERALAPITEAALRAERIASLITLELAYRGRRYGLIRLYGRSRLEFDSAQTALLRTIVEHVAAAVAAAELLQTERRHRQMQRHLKLAADVQARMRPRARPGHPDLDIEARVLSSLELAGDFFDIFEFHGAIGLIVADVVGKGVPAALLMASLRASLRAHALGDRDIASILRRTNIFLTRDTLDQEFATLFFAAIDPHTRTLTYTNAGHEPPFVVRAGAGHAEPLTEGGTILGVDETQDFPSASVTLAPGDTLVVCTDGLIEAQNFEGRAYGRRRLRDTVTRYLRENPEATSRAVADHAIWEVRRFVGLHEHADDTTIAVIRVRPDARAATIGTKPR